MINLLPPSYKKQISYARQNRTLFIWIGWLLTAIAFTATIIIIGHLFLAQSVSSIEKEVNASEQELKDENIEETKKKVEEISNNVKLTVDVLSKEVLFSKLLQQLGASLPAGSALENIQIEEVQGSLTIKAQAINIENASQVQINLEDERNNIFEKVDIESINCIANDSEKVDPFPCKVQLKALFKSESPFLYIAPNAKKSGNES